MKHPRFKLVPGIAGGLGPHAHIWLEQRLLDLARNFGLGIKEEFRNSDCGFRIEETEEIRPGCRKSEIRNPKSEFPIKSKFRNPNSEIGGDADYPAWIVCSMPQTPDRTAALLAGGPDPAPFLLASLHRLKAAGADFAAIACNTAHAFLPRLADAGPLPLPVVHVVVETVEFVQRNYPTARRIGLLATTGTCRADLFAAAFAARGFELVYPDEPTQEQLVMTAIYGPAAASPPAGGAAGEGRRAGGIKAGLIDQPVAWGLTPRAMLRLAAEWLVQRRQVEVVVLACSEISLALGGGGCGLRIADCGLKQVTSLNPDSESEIRNPKSEIPLVDTMDVLAEAILDLASGRRELASLPGPDRWPRTRLLG